jgi:AmmeMemoRadiSam system protein A
LLKIARGAIEQVVIRDKARPHIDLRGLTPKLVCPGAAFVTLTTPDGQLRGCRGSVVAIEPLAISVAHSAVEAATQDPRFPAVQADELSEIHIEINVLSPPELVGGIEEFICGQHGLILQINGHRGLFLPEVMARQQWSAEETLRQLCRKAGLSPKAWQTGYTLYVFETQIIREADRA